LDVREARIAHQSLDLPWFRQFKDWGRRRQVYVYVPKRRNGLKNYLEQIAPAFGPIPEGDGIASGRLQHAMSFAYSLRRIRQMQ
jgi:hypothetical protein